MPDQYYCPKCGRTKSVKEFYLHKDKTPGEFCKACQTLHINNFDPETFTWLLKEYDVPYIEAEWNVLRDRAYQKDPYKMTGMSVFGKYLSKMKLKQFSQFGWADTERLQAEAEEKAKLYGTPAEQQQAKLEEIKQAYEEGIISEAQYQTYVGQSTAVPAPPTPGQSNPAVAPPPQAASPYPVNENPYVMVEIPDVGSQLTDDDKIYLATKWGRLYTPEDWVALEDTYKKFCNSFDIQDASRIDILKFICKTSLKANQALDSGDIESYQKLMKVYDQQMKAGKFTEAQNKDKEEEQFDCVGVIVDFAEKMTGPIPRFKIDYPLDKADEVLMKIKDYNKNLIMSDVSLAQQIENFLKKKEILEQQKKDKEEAKKAGFESVIISDQDHIDFSEEIARQKEEDEAL